VLLRAEQPLGGGDVERKQSRQRQINFLDLGHIQTVTQRAQPRHLVVGQGHRGVGAQRRPFGAPKDPIRREVIVSTLFHTVKI
jgi:hypothetical protein